MTVMMFHMHLSTGLNFCFEDIFLSMLLICQML